MIEVLQVPSELEQMTQLYRERKPQSILEIGSWQGGTLRVWLDSAPQRVVAVDLNHQSAEQYPDWRRDPTELEVIEGDSQDRAIKLLILRLSPFDWIFVDGDHRPGEALSDVTLGIEAAASGALLLIHDIVTCWDVALGGWTEGPRLAFEQAREGRESWEYVDPEPMRWGHGIGVVQL